HDHARHAVNAFDAINALSKSLDADAESFSGHEPIYADPRRAAAATASRSFKRSICQKNREQRSKKG
ncbi:MAG TPA: hypothetical protein PLR50_14325, partial [Candidatus Rifleibacterium sp.]|nr:hypothetical protein [Candidatus Rifleibacterium sp.]